MVAGLIQAHYEENEEILVSPVVKMEGVQRGWGGAITNVLVDEAESEFLRKEEERKRIEEALQEEELLAVQNRLDEQARIEKEKRLLEEAQQRQVQARQSACHPNYGWCVPIASDVDCAGWSGDGPAYVQWPVKVIGPDVYRLDRDWDGWGCE